MTVSQRFKRFAIPSRVPLLFSPRMAQVTAAETSTRNGNGVHVRALLTYGISPVDSCLDCMAREATLPTRMYLANRSRSLIFNRYSTRGACRRHVLTLVNSKPRTLRKQRTHVLLPQVFNCNWHNLHWDCIIHPAVLPPCAFFMKRPMYNIIT